MIKNCAAFKFQSKHQSPRKQVIECIRYIGKELKDKGLIHRKQIGIRRRDSIISITLKYKKFQLYLALYEQNTIFSNRMSLTCLNKVVIPWKDMFKKSRFRFDEENYPTEALVKLVKEVQDIMDNDSRFSDINWMIHMDWFNLYYDEDMSDEFSLP
jgi:hypothetical protein